MPERPAANHVFLRIRQCRGQRNFQWTIAVGFETRVLPDVRGGKPKDILRTCKPQRGQESQAKNELDANDVWLWSFIDPQLPA